MTNEFGEVLDRNGYAESIFAKRQDVCAICNRSDRVMHRHEVFHGSNREKSKQYGLWVCVCYKCHHNLHQHDNSIDRALKQVMQRCAQERYNWSVDDFRRRFGKNWLEDEDE